MLQNKCIPEENLLVKRLKAAYFAIGTNYEKHNTLPFLFRSRQNGIPKPSKKNWPSGKELLTLVSDIVKISILSLIISTKESNLLWIELIFRCAKISLLR